MLNSEINKLCFVFLSSALKPLTELIKGFQSDDVEVIKLMNDIDLLFYSYFQMIITPVSGWENARNRIYQHLNLEIIYADLMHIF